MIIAIKIPIDNTRIDHILTVADKMSQFEKIIDMTEMVVNSVNQLASQKGRKITIMTKDLEHTVKSHLGTKTVKHHLLENIVLTVVIINIIKINAMANVTRSHTWLRIINTILILGKITLTEIIKTEKEIRTDATIVSKIP